VLARWLVEPHLERHSLKMLRLTKRGIHRMWRGPNLREEEMLTDV
jgi:hypothetical protein